jgi:predicted permease
MSSDCSDHTAGAIRVTIFEAPMAPIIGAAIVAMEHKLDPPLVTLMVGIGIPLSFLTLPVWWLCAVRDLAKLLLCYSKRVGW